MSEGLLYKKAEANSYLQIGPLGEYEEDSILELSMVTKILDEAKADMPTVNFHNLSDLIKFADWVKKWFGAINANHEAKP
jgi:hypothetical protein